MKDRQTVLTGIGIGIGVVIVLLAVFFAGIFFGGRKAGLFPFWERRQMQPNGFVSPKLGHGISGIIDSIGNNTFIVKDRTGALKTVLVDNKTILRRNNSEIKFSDIKKGEQAIVIGEPQEKEGAIQARVIRIMDNLVKDASPSAAIYGFPRFGRDLWVR